MLSASAAAADRGHYHDTLSDSQAKNGLALFESAAKSPRDDIYDAAVQFYAADIRVISGAKRFPLNETGEDSPLREVDQGFNLATTDKQKNPESIKQAREAEDVIVKIKKRK